jgi:hypothetical protein
LQMYVSSIHNVHTVRLGETSLHFSVEPTSSSQFGNEQNKRRQYIRHNIVKELT